MVWAFMGSLMICGVYDLRFKEVPLWSIVILYMVGLGVCAMHHPFLSALITIVVMLFCFVSKMGAADKMIFPI
ncbi:hypothetical protein ACTHQ2_23600, partial [Bacillus subtilis]|uniref:hypothetical protein n=1 Tax=Bacillus subtilis TaxID=1423 RepID=UPI003F7BB74C